MTEPATATTWVLDPWESQALGLRVGRVKLTEASSLDLADAWAHGVDVVYVDAAGPLPATGLGEITFVGVLRELDAELQQLAPSGGPDASTAGITAHARVPAAVDRFDLGGRYERDPRLAPRGVQVYRRWVSDASVDPHRRVWTLDGDTGLLVLALDETTTRIELIGVDRDHRGQGLGSVLVRLAVAQAVAAGAARLVVGGYDHNHAAMRLYESSGLRETSRRWRYHVHRPDRQVA